MLSFISRSSNTDALNCFWIAWKLDQKCKKNMLEIILLNLASEMLKWLKYLNLGVTWPYHPEIFGQGFKCHELSDNPNVSGFHNNSALHNTTMAEPKGQRFAKRNASSLCGNIMVISTDCGGNHLKGQKVFVFHLWQASWLKSLSSFSAISHFYKMTDSTNHRVLSTPHNENKTKKIIGVGLQTVFKAWFLITVGLMQTFLNHAPNRQTLTKHHQTRTWLCIEWCSCDKTENITSTTAPKEVWWVSTVRGTQSLAFWETQQLFSFF